MKYILYRISSYLRYYYKILIGRIRGLVFTGDLWKLKATSYQNLPIPLPLEKLSEGRDIEVEIGSGHGEVLLANDPQKSIRIGYEIRSRFFRLIQRKIWKRKDIMVFKGDAYHSLKFNYKNDSISKIWVLFPDPWHKKRHNKRRPLNELFFKQVAQKLKNKGTVFVATDWKDYADYITEEVKKVKSLFEIKIGTYTPEEHNIPITHYYQKWLRKGRTFTAFVLTKK